MLKNGSDPILRCIHMYGKFAIGVGDIELACINNETLYLPKILGYEGGLVNKIVLAPGLVSSFAKAVGDRRTTLIFTVQRLH